MEHGEHEVTLAENPSQGTMRARIHNAGGGLSAGQHPLPGSTSMYHFCCPRREMYSTHRAASAVFSVSGTAETICCPKLDTGQGDSHVSSKHPAGLDSKARPVRDVGADSRQCR